MAACFGRQQFGTTVDDYGYGIATDSTGVYVTGYTYGGLSGTSAGGYDAFVRKYNTSGSVLWTQQFGTTTTDLGYGIATDSSGVYVTGATSGGLSGTNAGGQDAFVRKYNTSGSLQWTRQFGTTGTDYGSGIATDSTGVYLTGRTTGGLSGTNAGGNDAFVRKYHTSGSLQWTQQFGTTGTDYGSAIATDSAGVYVTGRTDGGLVGTNAGSQDAFVRKFNTSGSVLWTQQLGTTGSEYGRGIATDSSGVYVTGDTSGGLGGSNAGNYDAFVAKFNVAASYVGGGGSVINGYLVDATAFFDVNKNGLLDPNEPWGLTDSTGQFDVPVPAIYDLNENGTLDDDEGQWVVFGGSDSSTGLPAVDTLIAPGSWTTVTPLTTLVAALSTGYGLTVADSKQHVLDAFGLPDLELETLDPIAESLAGNADASAAFAAHAQVQNTIAQISALLGGVAASPQTS